MTHDLDVFGRTQLHYAAVENNAKKALDAIDAGAHLNRKDQYGVTPLHVAAQSNAAGIVRVLLEAGATVDPETPNGHTPLFFAVVNSEGKGDIIGLLRDAGADPYKCSSSGMSPIYVARNITDCDAAQFFADLPELDTNDT